MKTHYLENGKSVCGTVGAISGTVTREQWYNSKLPKCNKCAKQVPIRKGTSMYQHKVFNPPINPYSGPKVA